MVDQTSGTPEARPLDALLSIALQLKAQLDSSVGIQRNLTKEAVFLRTFGFKNPEIATILGSTPASVAELISRAQKTTKEAKKSVKKEA